MTRPESRITYVVSSWPAETFVTREACALEASGVAVDVVSLRPAVADPRFPVASLRPPVVIGAVLRALLQSPLRVVRVLGRVAMESSPRTLVARLGAALVGIAWVERGIVRPGQRLHAHFGWVAATAVWASSQLVDVDYSVVLHAFELHDRRHLDRFAPRPLRAAQRVFTISEADRALVRARWGVEAHLVRMGVPQSWIAAHGHAGDDMIVSVGRLVEKKGFEVLLDALAMTQHPWRCQIVGDGPLRPSLERRARELGVEGRVELLGHRSEQEVAVLVSEAALACLACVETSHGDRDGVPVALIEAMAAGTAVVSTSVGGVPELVDAVGVLVPPGDADALAHALDALAEPALRADLGEAGRRRVQDGWTIDAAVEVLRRELFGAPA